MRAAFTLFVLTLAAPAAADRLAPNKTRDAVLGCWDAGSGATLEVSAFGKHSATFEARFTTRPRGGPEVMKGDATWVPSSGEFEVSCRPLSQHGSFCRISPAADGLRIRVFAKRHGSKSEGRLVEDFVAPHCAG